MFNDLMPLAQIRVFGFGFGFVELGSFELGLFELGSFASVRWLATTTTGGQATRTRTTTSPRGSST
jgi:hypothetical protein